MKKLFLIFCILTLCTTISSGGVVDKLKSVIARKNASVAYCDNLGWTPSLSPPSFTLDFDHTDNNLQSCYTSEEIGTLSGASVATPGVEAPSTGSQGDALLANADGDVIIFDNTGSYQIAFIISVAVNIIALILVSLLKPLPQTEVLK